MRRYYRLYLSGGAGVLKEHENLKFPIFFSAAQISQFGLINELERWCSAVLKLRSLYPSDVPATQEKGIPNSSMQKCFF